MVMLAMMTMVMMVMMIDDGGEDYNDYDYD